MTKAIRTGSPTAEELEPDIDRAVGVVHARALARRNGEAPPQRLVARETNDGACRGLRNCTDQLCLR